MKDCGLSSFGRQNMFSVMEVQREGAVGTGGLRRAGGMGKILPASSIPA